MREMLHEQLMRDTEALRRMLSKFSTESVVGLSNAKLLHWFGANGNRSPLASPMRQVFFMLGLMLTTVEPDPAKDFGDDEFNQAVPLLNSIFHAYVLMYWPDDHSLSEMPDEWRKRREVAMGTFLHYFNTELTASHSALRERILLYLSPFDQDLISIKSISATQALEVVDWIVESFQESSDRLVDLLNEESRKRRSLTEQWKEKGWDLQRLRKEAIRTSYQTTATEIAETLTSFMKVDLSELERNLGEDIARAFWDRFVAKRDGHASFTYLTESNPVEQRPLILLPGGMAMCPSPSFLLTALLEGMEKDILASSSRDSFLRHRDKALEKEVVRQFERVFPPARLHANIFETADLQFEHDLVVVWDDTLLVVEAKASSPREPFRDPEKAFTRIRDDFSSDSGLQGAYDQANRLLMHIQSGKQVDLFDGSHQVAVSIDPRKITSAFGVCVTRDDLGPLAVDLSPLLEKPVSSSYPWAINILDLAYLFDTWQYFRWGPTELLRYISQRVKVHGKVTSFDELEVAGFFVEHGSLQSLIDLDADRIMLSIDYSDVFDKVYATSLGGAPPSYNPREPQFRFVGPKLAVVGPA